MRLWTVRAARRRGLMPAAAPAACRRLAAAVLAASVLSATALVATGLTSTALAATGTGTPPAVAAPTQRVSLLTVEGEVMCLSCHEPLEAVSSPQALQEKATIEGLIVKGDSNQQILNQMVAQYGVGVLAKPPASGFNLLIYVLPPLVLALGAVFLIVTLPKWRRRSRAAAASPLLAPPPVSPADGRRIDEDLARLV